MHKVEWNYIFPYGNPMDAQTYYNTPIRLREAVCWQRDHKVEAFIWLNGEWAIAACSKCVNVLAYRINRCIKCEKDYILDFTHVKYCPLYPTCWDCTENLENGCPDHEAPAWSKNHPPIGLTPKTFTKEELDDFDIDAPIPWMT